MIYVIPKLEYTIDVSEKIKQIQTVVSRINSCRDRGLSESLKQKIFKQIRITHVYNSNAIEGNSLSLRETEVILDNLELNDKPLKDQIEAKTLGNAFDFLMSLISGKEKISKKAILDLHSILMRDINSIKSGRWRYEDVKIGGCKHTPPCWADIDDHLSIMFDWFEHDNTYSIILKAAILHHWFVWIHPFHDGNGRVSRLLLNFFLLQNGYPEVIIRIEDRDKYYNALQNCDNGDITFLVDLIADKLFETSNIYSEFINEEQREKEWLNKFNEIQFKRKQETERFNYEVWKSQIEVFGFRFNQLLGIISEKLTDIKFSTRFYDIISLNKYLDLLESKDVSNTWYMTIRLSKENFEDLLIVFYFERFYPKLANGIKANIPYIKLYYSIRRAGDSLQKNYNIDLDNVGVKRDKLVFGLRSKEIRKKIESKELYPGDVIRNFIDQILNEYFKF